MASLPAVFRSDLARNRMTGFFLAGILLTYGSVLEASPNDGAVDWKTIRDGQPTGLTMNLELPKTTYYQGEAIEGTVTFTNTGTQAFHVHIADPVYPRAGNVTFHATDTHGSPARDPTAWYEFVTGYFGSSSIATEDLGTWKATRSVNAWVSFDQPGVYSIFACGTVKEGMFEEWIKAQRDPDQSGMRPGARIAWVRAVSDPVTITILPLSPDEEKRLIAAATERIASGGKEAEAGAQTLRFLGTPAARSALLPLIGSREESLDTIATLGICAAPDSEAEADRVLEEVRSGRLKANRSVIALYRTLKTAFLGQASSVQRMMDLSKRWGEVMQSSVAEISSAAVSATDGKGGAYHQALIDSFLNSPREEYRQVLVRDQLSLEPGQIAAIFEAWQNFKSPDFQPLVRKAVGSPYYNATALRALAETEPEKARPLIIEDFQREVPRRYSPPGQRENSALFALPDGPVPELDAYFRRQLTTLSPDANELPEFLVLAINHYGTPALLPDLIAFHRKKREIRDCEAEAAVYEFWARNDPPNGVSAVLKLLQQENSGNCHGMILNAIFKKPWSGRAIAAVGETLSDSDPRMVAAAIYVLEHYADARWLAPSILAVERLALETGKSTPSRSASLTLAIGYLLESQRWKLSDPQRQKLETLQSQAQ